MQTGNDALCARRVCEYVLKRSAVERPNTSIRCLGAEEYANRISCPTDSRVAERICKYGLKKSAVCKAVLPAVRPGLSASIGTAKKMLS